MKSRRRNEKKDDEVLEVPKRLKNLNSQEELPSRPRSKRIQKSASKFSVKKKQSLKFFPKQEDLIDEDLQSEDGGNLRRRGPSKRLKTNKLKQVRRNSSEGSEESDLEDLLKQFSEEQEEKKNKKRKQNKRVINSEQEESSQISNENEDSAYEGDKNDDFCWRCNGKNGQLIPCDSCYRSFHLPCSNLKRYNGQNWDCTQCLQCDNSKCSYCGIISLPVNGSILENNNLAIAQCSKCNLAMHLNCILDHQMTLEMLLLSPVNKKYFHNEKIQEFLSQYAFKNKEDREASKVKLQNEVYNVMVMENRILFYICVTCLQNCGVATIMSHLKVSEDNTYYLTQLDQSSILHCHYLHTQTLTSINPRKLKNYREKYESKSDSDSDAIYNGFQDDDILEYLEIERVIGCKKGSRRKKMTWKEVYADVMELFNGQYKCQFGNKNNLKFLVKWARLFYDQCTWEDEYFLFLRQKQEIQQFLQLKIFEESIGTQQFEEEKRAFLKITWNPQMALRDKSQPIFINGGNLHPFQIEGLNWLRKSWELNNNVILADEMGLGKTIQTISFLNCLQYEKQISGPFLIIAPATTLYNWLKEFKRWADRFNVIVYTGNQESRELIRRKEFYFGNKEAIQFNAIITSYDTTIIDQAVFKKIQWQCLIIDEAHRLKNNESKFFKVCSQFSTKHKILLTGTPLQNNIIELINLIEFISPHKAKQMKNIESLQVVLFTGTQQRNDAMLNISEQFDFSILDFFSEDKKRSLSELTKILHPHILRRTKANVNLQVPEMEEIIVKLCLTDTQKFLYKNVLLKNYENLRILDQKSKHVAKANLLNILMSLRLVCNHPYLFLYKRQHQEGDLNELIPQSNKVKFLDRIIPRLLDMKHKMLIFSQFTMMLDLLQRYLEGRGWPYERLDGTTSIMDRQRIIDTFNKDDSRSQIFLLSTRAGGLGINLTSADTIIFTDSDFNPYRDLQAISRAHRMGQVKKVKVYRLVSKYTAEERIIEIATKKLLLEEIIINPINKFTKDDFTQIFKNSTWELFNKNLEEKDTEFTEEQLTALLQRNNSQQQSEDVEKLNIVKNDLNDYYLSGFKFTSLNFETVEPQLDEEDPKERQGKMDKYWETLLDGEARMLVEKEQNEMGKGKRVKKQYLPNYQEDALLHSSKNPSEYSPSNPNQISESDNEEQQDGGDHIVKFKKEAKILSERVQKQMEKDQAIIKLFQTVALDQAELKQFNGLSEEEDNDLVVHGFSIFHRIDFLEFVMKYGMEFDSLEQFLNMIGCEKSQTFKGEIRPQNEEFKKYLREFYAILLDFENFMDKENIVFCGLNVENWKKYFDLAERNIYENRWISMLKKKIYILFKTA